jgi:16S rRNA (guanine527-N7)-methyltransferase
LSDLVEGLRVLGLEDTGKRVETLKRYISEIELWNPRYGLVAPGEDIVGRHVLDSLSGLESLRRLAPRNLADVGSGAGFPGIPLAIWLDDTEITLIERSGRRAGFLRNVVLSLGLSHITVLEKPVEEVGAGGSRFDVITFRAWSAIDETLLKTLGGILAEDGVIAAYKGKIDVIEKELAGVSRQLESREIIPLTTPFQKEERRMVLLRMKDR